jgi:hypothetical protein
MNGHKSPLVGFALIPAHQEGGKEIAAATITGKVHEEQILSGPLTQELAWAKAQNLQDLVVEDGAPVHMVEKVATNRAQAGIVNVKRPGSSTDLNHRVALDIRQRPSETQAW